MRVDATDDHVTLRATSLDWDVQCAMAAEVAVPAEAWMPANLVRALPWGGSSSRPGSAVRGLRLKL